MSFFEAIDPVFRTYVLGNAPVKQIATGFDWTEGPVWFGDAGCLLFSDIPNNRIMRWTPGAGASVYREPSNYANGHTRDREGRLVSCEHGGRRVTRTELDGSITIIADRYRGKRLNSPNDVVVKSDGTIWFTDPHYGISTNYEGFKSDQELPCNVYRVDLAAGSVEAVIADCNGPNGLAFSPDERRLYVADTGRMFGDDPTHIRVFDVEGDGALSGGDVFPRRPSRRGGRVSARQRRQPLDLGCGRCALHRSGRSAARQDPGARAGLERVLRRASEAPALRHRVDLRLLRRAQPRGRPAPVGPHPRPVRELLRINAPNPCGLDRTRMPQAVGRLVHAPNTGACRSGGAVNDRRRHGGVRLGERPPSGA